MTVAIGYIPYDRCKTSVEASWLAEGLGCQVYLAYNVPSLNLAGFDQLPDLDIIKDAVKPLIPLSWVVVEGPGGFLWSAILRANGYRGGLTILPYLNPRHWYDVVCVANYLRSADPRDHIFLGSTPSARIYKALGVSASVGEPYGINCDLFCLRPEAPAVLDKLGIPSGRLLLFAGRVQADKNIYRFLQVALRARFLFPDLSIVIASHVVDEGYLAEARRQLGADHGVYFVMNPKPDELADLYNVASVFATAATSHFETFGRAPAEALACGTPAIAPRYDGFAEVLAQPGGMLVDMRIVDGMPQVDEELMLRAIYDVLSSHSPVPAEEISATARNRFCRSQTIHLLDHVLNPALGQATPDQIPPAELALPSAWITELREMAFMPRQDALARLWKLPESRELSKYDDQLQDSVRLSLYRSANEIERDWTTCH